MATTAAQEPKLSMVYVEPQWIRFIAGGMASATAEIFTLPIDCTKVRLQAQRDVTASVMSHAGNVSVRTPPQYNGMLDAARKITAEEGASALWKGATPALMRQVSYTSICMVLYEPLRDMFGANANGRAEVPFVNRFLAGGFAGAIGISLANPVDVIKVRMQADRSGTLYRGVGDAFTKIYQKEGLRGFFRGMPPNIQRGFIVNAAELGTYDQSKEFFITSGILPDGVIAHTGASFAAGFAGAAASNPIDVIKTRLMTQPTNTLGKGTMYDGVLDCAKKTFQEGGVQAFYKGFIPNWMRKAPWCVMFFVTYEKYRAALSPDY
ncbi:TPA: hypothetical protein N0F65_011591 [Lagenidium giganteum]|uniref:Uncharacterized protein n=1 Tax=Lagenidium giganteum TaxID=4803 RepID=A0AAV2Z902_9STRA|nr:TPA: hypothetical protein N0F65_011591 [Lagenidium giganteum]